MQAAERAACKQPRKAACNPDFGTGTSNPDFGAGTSNVDFGAGTSNYGADDYYPSMVAVTSGLQNIAIYHSEPSQSQIHVSENFTPHQDAAVDPILDTFGNLSDASSEPDEVDYPIPPEDGPNDVDINIMAENFAQGMSSSPEPVQTNRTTPQSFYRSMPFFDQTFPEIPADSIDVPIMKYAKFYNKNKGKLDVGMLFKNKVELIEAVKDHSIRHARREYYVTESSKTKWKVVCLHSTPGQVQQNPSYGIKHVIQTVKDHTGYDIPYQKAWYSLKMAREIVYGTWESSVQKLPKYMGALKKYNPGTIVEWEHKVFQPSTGAHVIGYVFWAFAPCIEGFQFCRNVISVDGTHLYTKYRHKMLIAAAMDGNQQDLCWRAGSEYQIRKFNRIMEEIKSQNVAAFEFLDKINKKKWTASHDGGWRTGILTTNMSECINGVLKGARRLPLTAIVEITLARTVNYFVTRERRSHAMVANGQLWTDFAYKMFNQWHQKSIDHTVTKYNHRQQSASVVTKRQSGFGLNTHVVKITNRECSCGKWTQFGIPCSHAQKVCAAYNINAASMVKNYMMFKLTRIHILRLFNHCIRKIIGMPRNFGWSMIRLFVSLHVQVEIKHHVFITRWIGGKRVKGSKLNKEKILQDNKSIGVGLYTIIVFLHF
ncbi:UNVERIFIED_CONTAM: hypothetical protein Sradi_6225200 [Sesamum radiatum]|uniref:SWIM-type domain-containing protein n=1 Tax=Sesamum radiatum TaxID=300843 RepID=A0AAW2K9P6_SESRA